MISDKLHEQRLRDKDAVIVTDYFDGGSTKRRSSDHSSADDIRAGVILAKKYYLHGKLRHQETEFNPGMVYSYVFPALEDGTVQCPNCGAVGTDALFSEGCPYCGAFYNMDYQSEVPGARDHSDYVTDRRKTLLLPCLLIMAVCIAVGILLAVATSRTATLFDYGKGVLLGALVGGAICFVVGYSRSKVTLTTAEMKKKQKQDRVLGTFRKDLEENGLSMGTFFNSLNLGLRDHYFGSDSEDARDVIDFDVLDYRGQKLEQRDGAVTVTTDVKLRLIRGDEDRVWSKESVKRIRLRRSAGTAPQRRAGLNITACPYCGASIDLSAKRCSYCGTAFLYDRPLNIEKVSNAAD